MSESQNQMRNTVRAYPQKRPLSSILNTSHSSYPDSLIRSCNRFLSFSIVSAFDEAASPCRFISRNPFLSLKRPNQPLLNLNLSSSGIPAKSANVFHFWRRISPVSRIPSFIAFETQRFIISVTSGCSVCRTRLAVRSLCWLVSSHWLRHLTSFLIQDEISGCLI